MNILDVVTLRHWPLKISAWNDETASICCGQCDEELACGDPWGEMCVTVKALMEELAAHAKTCAKTRRNLC